MRLLSRIFYLTIAVLAFGSLIGQGWLWHPTIWTVGLLLLGVWCAWEALRASPDSRGRVR